VIMDLSCDDDLVGFRLRDHHFPTAASRSRASPRPSRPGLDQVLPARRAKAAPPSCRPAQRQRPRHALAQVEESCCKDVNRRCPSSSVSARKR
jgi:hypothetical protein